MKRMYLCPWVDFGSGPTRSIPTPSVELGLVSWGWHAGTEGTPGRSCAPCFHTQRVLWTPRWPLSGWEWSRCITMSTLEVGNRQEVADLALVFSAETQEPAPYQEVGLGNGLHTNLVFTLNQMHLPPRLSLGSTKVEGWEGGQWQPCLWHAGQTAHGWWPGALGPGPG